MNPLLANIPARTHSQDRVGTVLTSFGPCYLLADGAGGTSGGAEAAEFFVSQMSDLARACHDVRDLLSAFRDIDVAMERSDITGETTGVFVTVSATELVGASVGDSEAWLVTDSDVVKLTSQQERKPLLGSGHSAPTVFTSLRTRGVLILASDGLFKYTRESSLLATLREGVSENVLQQCIDLVRLPSGNLQDDISIILAEI